MKKIKSVHSFWLVIGLIFFICVHEHEHKVAYAKFGNNGSKQTPTTKEIFHVCIHIFYICINIHISIHTHIYTNVCVCINVCVYMYMYVCVHTNVYSTVVLQFQSQCGLKKFAHLNHHGCQSLLTVPPVVHRSFRTASGRQRRRLQKVFLKVALQRA